MSLLNFIVEPSLSPGQVRSYGILLSVDEYPLLHRALPFGPRRLHKTQEDCRDNVRCSPGECCDCSVWVVQHVCLVSRSRGVAGLLQ